MKIGFAILSHQAPGPMLEKLLSFLQGFPDKKIVIHHDASQSEFDANILRKYNAQLTPKFHKTGWAQIGIVKATYECIGDLVDADWIILLSTNDYPIKSVKEIIGFFEQTTYNVFIDGTPVEHNKNDWDLLNWIYDGVFKRKILAFPSVSKTGKFKWRHIKINKSNRHLNNDQKLFFGSQWFMIDKKVADFLRSIDFENDSVVKFLSSSDICKDETIFQTLIYNKRDFNISKESFRYINWDDVNDWHPNILTNKHLGFIKDSPALFARKFDFEKSGELIEAIDGMIDNS